MKLALGHKTVNTVLQRASMAAALLAGAMAQAAESGPIVTIVAIDPNASEAGHAALFLATRDGPNAQTLVVPIQVSGTATAGADYASLGASINFPAQMSMVMVKIVPVADTLVEGAETVVVTLLAKPGAYTLGDEKSATATIADAAGAAKNAPGKSGPAAPPAQAPAHTGTLTVEVTLDGQGNWKHPTNGAYSKMKFHRSMSYTMALDGVVGGGSGFTEIDRREEKTQGLLPNFYRYMVLQPHAAMTNQVGVPCGKGDIRISDEYQGMEVGDPGQPPLVPYTETWRGGGAFPSGDKTVPERDLCMTRVTFDNDKHVVHIVIDGSDSHIKTRVVHNGFDPNRPFNVRMQGEDLNGSAKAKLTFFDVPIPAGAKTFDLSRVIENFSQVTGKGNTTIPLHATVKWRVTAK